MSHLEAPIILGDLDGLPVMTYITKEKMEPLKHIELYPDDIFICSYPKSGTTWVQQIVKLLLNGGVDDQQSIHKTIPYIDIEGKAALQQPSPRIVKTHLPYQRVAGGLPPTTAAKYIYIARNPKDTAVSYFHHTRAMRHYEYTGDWNDYFRKFMTGRVAQGSWFDNVLGWWAHNNASNILFLKYEDLHKDFPGTIIICMHICK